MPIVRQIRISSLVISLASPSPQRMQYQPVLESNPQIVPLYCCVLICCDWGVREEWVYTETMIGRLLSRYCVLSLLQSGRGGFSAWSSTFRLWVQVDASLVARDRGPSSVSGYFLFQVVPRGLNLVLLELCNKWEGGGARQRWKQLCGKTGCCGPLRTNILSCGCYWPGRAQDFICMIIFICQRRGSGREKCVYFCFQGVCYFNVCSFKWDTLLPRGKCRVTVQQKLGVSRNWYL